MPENKTSSLHKHLMGGDISALETALKLKPTVGFPYSDYKYYIYEWDSEEDYDDFICYADKNSSISGHVYDKTDETTYGSRICECRKGTYQRYRDRVETGYIADGLCLREPDLSGRPRCFGLFARHPSP